MVRWGRAVAFWMVAACSARGGNGSSGGAEGGKVVFEYKGVGYEMDSYQELFSGDPLAEGRRSLFEDYLSSAPEGRFRSSGGKSASEVWEALTWEEKTTFLAITGALHKLATEAGEGLLGWAESLQEIHGEVSVTGGKEYKNDEAFRLFVKLTQEAVAHIDAGNGSFSNACTAVSVTYDGLGSSHGDFCAPGEDFEGERKTANHPNLQFNYSRGSRCADIDIDYRKGLGHLSRDNSNVLASKQIRKFEEQYCDAGFRLKP